MPRVNTTRKLPAAIRDELRRTSAIILYSAIMRGGDSMKTGEIEKRMHNGFHGIGPGKDMVLVLKILIKQVPNWLLTTHYDMLLSPIDATSQIHLLTTGQGVYAFLFDIDESTNKRILKKMFHRLDISLHLGVDITAVLIECKNLTTLELFGARSLKYAAFVVITKSWNWNARAIWVEFWASCFRCIEGHVWLLGRQRRG